MVQNHKANKAETHTHEMQSKLSALSPGHGSAVSINHSPGANRRGDPVKNPTACAEQRPRTAKCHLEPAGPAGFVRQGFSSGPEGAEMGLGCLYCLICFPQGSTYHASIIPVLFQLEKGWPRGWECSAALRNRPGRAEMFPTQLSLDRL